MNSLFQWKLELVQTGGVNMCVTRLPFSHSPADGERAGARIRRKKISRFEPLNRMTDDVAQASSPASSPGVPPGVRSDSETLPQLAAGTDCATRFTGTAASRRRFFPAMIVFDDRLRM